MEEDIIILVLGFVIIIFSYIFYDKQKVIKKNGLITEGIIYSFAYNEDVSFSLKYPIVRFTTLTEEWITETANVGIVPGIFKKGQKIKIIYNANNPKQFIIKSRLSNSIIFLILIIGCLLFLFGLYKLINIKP